jgi:beta-alanine degradation protein BauB
MGSGPVGTNILFENSRVRVWEMVLAPGETCPPHGHLHDYLMLYTTPSVITSGAPGQQVIQQIEPGAVAYHAVGAAGLPPHAISNAGHTDSHHFASSLAGLALRAMRASRAGIAEPRPSRHRDAADRGADDVGKIIEYTLVSADGVHSDPAGRGFLRFRDDAYLRDGLGVLAATRSPRRPPSRKGPAETC